MADLGQVVVSGENSERASLLAVGTWHQQLLLFSLPALQPLLSQDLGEVSPSPPPPAPLGMLPSHACRFLLSQVLARHK